MINFKYKDGDIVNNRLILSHKILPYTTAKRTYYRKIYECQCIKCKNVINLRQEVLEKTKYCRNCIQQEEIFRYNINDIIDNHLLVLERFHENGIRKYKVKCLNDNYCTVVQEQTLLHHKYNCAVCSNIVIKSGVNDLKTLYPNIAKLVPDYIDTTTIGTGDHVKIDIYCPTCKKLLKNKNIRTIIRYGNVPCPQCRGISKNERVCTKILEMLHEDYIPQKVFDWLPNRRYDFYIDRLKLIIELHGRQHYEKVDYFKHSGEDQQKIDAEKRSKALAHGYLYLEIDCSSKKNIVILNNIFDKLSEIFDLSNISIDNILV